MNRTISSRIALGLGAIAIAVAAGSASPGLHAQHRQSANAKPITLSVDVATDASSFRFGRETSLLEARRGDTFIVEGRIYPAGTIEPGGSLEAPGPFDPTSAPGSIGTWVLRGTFNHDFTEILAGASPFVFGTQYFMFDDGRVLVSEGGHGGPPQLRTIIGGAGDLSGATGEVLEEIIGVNGTGLFNQRFTFQIRKQSIK
ncbi:MAG: hypothetical protein IPF53_01620 [Blastocatellia bacterium]|jgi:hypothetical protein|nr:hypothetical protein [Blastocatellia bacterium]MBK6425345.1 hypothetical protein [Blastocatellia bacterium]